MRKIKGGDNVKVISGKFKGEVAVVEKVAEDAVYLKGVNVVKRAVKGKGFVEKTLPVNVSNIMIYCDKCKKPVRVSVKDGVRVCKKCGTQVK